MKEENPLAIRVDVLFCCCLFSFYWEKGQEMKMHKIKYADCQVAFNNEGKKKQRGDRTSSKGSVFYDSEL
jgi:hypothetical protein